MDKLKKYRFNDFNDDGALKVPLLLWGTLLYLSRHVLFLGLGGFSSFMLSRMGSGQGADFSHLHSRPIFLLASLPALAVVIAGLRRAPAGGQAVRTIWRYGRALLLGATTLDLGLFFVFWYLHPALMNLWLITAAVLDVYILAYLLRSQRVRDAFADFPEPVTK
jgi:hypothetical protein